MRHRLAVAGARRPIFTEDAVARLHTAPRGIPRVVNQLATQALLEGMARGAAEVDGGVIEAVAAERDFDVRASAPRG